MSSNTDPTEAYNHSTTYRYDLSGNITHKSDLGSYQYDQPYRLASAGSRHQNYRYDANGNVTSGGGRRLTWSSFNKPTRMSQGGATTSFSYGPERHRYRRIDQLEGQTTTRLYLGKRYEQISTGDRTTHKYFIYAGDQLAAIHFDEVDHRGDQSDYQTRYLHTDALGSVDLITDGAGGVVDKLSFDPSGQRRTATWRSVQQRLGQASLAPLLTNRGFTGHEHVDALGIIHMNGRIYDPELGRFLSADPTMQHPYSTQGQNRYAYVQNNPLKYVDMSGFGFFPKIFKGIKKVVTRPFKALQKATDSALRAIAKVPVLNTVVQTAVCFYGGPYACAAYAGRSTYAQTGEIGLSIRAAAFAYVGQQYFASDSPFSSLEQSFALIATAVDPKKGAYVNFLLNGFDTYQAALHNVSNYYVGRKFERIANKHGLSLYELNVLLSMNSSIGKTVAGTAYKEHNGKVYITGFLSRESLVQYEMILNGGRVSNTK